MKLTLSQIRARYDLASTRSPLFYRQENGKLYAVQIDPEKSIFELYHVRGSSLDEATPAEKRFLLEDEYARWDSNDPLMASAKLGCVNSCWKISMHDGTEFRTNTKPTFRGGGKLLHICGVYSIALLNARRDVDYYMEMSMSVLSVKEIEELRSYTISSRLNRPNPTDDF